MKRFPLPVPFYKVNNSTTFPNQLSLHSLWWRLKCGCTVEVFSFLLFYPLVMSSLQWLEPARAPDIICTQGKQGTQASAARSTIYLMETSQGEGSLHTALQSGGRLSREPLYPMIMCWQSIWMHFEFTSCL